MSFRAGQLQQTDGFDWLSNMQLLNGQEANIVSFALKRRKECFINPKNLPLKMGDLVATQVQAGDIGSYPAWRIVSFSDEEEHHEGTDPKSTV